MEHLNNVKITASIDTNKQTDNFSVDFGDCTTVEEMLERLCDFLNQNLDSNYVAYDPDRIDSQYV